MTVHDINDHMALTCECGSVHFNLLRSGGVECSGCGQRLYPLAWTCSHAWQMVQYGSTYHDLKCSVCGEVKRETWD